MYVPLERDVVDEKLRLLDAHFGSQRSKDWFDADVFRGLMRLQGWNAALRAGMRRRSSRAR